MKPAVLVLGLGNPLLSDDTIGLHIVETASEQLGPAFPNVAFKVNYSGSFDLLEDLAGFTHLLVIDSIDAPSQPLGSVFEYTLEDFQEHTQQAVLNWHSVNIPTLIEVGRKCAYALPETIIFFGIVGHQFIAFSEEPASELKLIIKQTVTDVKTQLNRWLNK